MDTLLALAKPPTWAADLCWYYFAVAALVAVYGLWAVVRLFTLPSTVQKNVPVWLLAVGILLSSGVAVVLTLLQFWICRGALAPAATKERFAVALGAMGQPQGEGCEDASGGQRGRCVMQNNVDDSGMAAIA